MMFDLETLRHVFREAHRSKRAVDIKIILRLPLSAAEIVTEDISGRSLDALGYTRQSDPEYDYIEHKDGPTVRELKE